MLGKTYIDTNESSLINSIKPFLTVYDLYNEANLDSAFPRHFILFYNFHSSSIVFPWQVSKDCDCVQHTSCDADIETDEIAQAEQVVGAEEHACVQQEKRNIIVRYIFMCVYVGYLIEVRFLFLS